MWYSLNSESAVVSAPAGDSKASQSNFHPLHIGTLVGALANQPDFLETVLSSDFSQASATWLLTFLDSTLQAPDGLQPVAVGLTIENTMIPTTSRHLALSLHDLEPPAEAAADSNPLDIEQEQGGSREVCS